MKHEVRSPWNNQVVNWEAAHSKSTSSSTPVSVKKKPKYLPNCHEGMFNF